MTDLEDLSEDEKSVLLACCDANNFSLGSHVPKEAIMRKLQKLNPKYKKKAFNKLLSKGLIFKHPTKRQATYQLSKYGLNIGNNLKEDFKKTL